MSTWNGSPQRELTTNPLSGKLGADQVFLEIAVNCSWGWDPRTSGEETLLALTGLQRAGKIRYFGSSTFPAYRVVQAQWAARDNHLSRYVTGQSADSVDTVRPALARQCAEACDGARIGLPGDVRGERHGLAIGRRLERAGRRAP